MAHFLNQNRPGYGNANYYECEQEVVRGPHDSYASEHRTQEYATPDYGRHHHSGGYVDRVSETENLRYQSNPDYGRHHHHNGGAAEFVERVEETVYEKGYEPRRGY